MHRSITVLLCTCLSACAPRGAGPAPVGGRAPAQEPTARACLDRAAELEQAVAWRDPERQLRAAQRLARELQRIRPRRPEGLARCEEQAQRMLEELERSAPWQQGRDRPALERTQRLCGLYLELFPRGPRAYDLAYRHAVALFALERWREAGEAYTRLVELDRRGRHAEEAARASVVAWGKAVSGTGQRPPNPAGKPLPIPGDHAKLLAACELFLRVAPTAADAPAILLRRARVYHDHAHHRQAVTGLAEIVTRHPEHAVAPHAASLLLDTLNLLGKRGEMKTWVARMLAEPRLARGALAVTLNKLSSALERRSVEALVDQKKYDACATRYRALADRDPTSPEWPELIYNAAVCLEHAGQRRRANIELKRLLSRRPEHVLAPRALLQVAQNHEGLDEGEEAAKHYEELARRYPGEKPAPDALARAVALRLGLKHNKQALADARLFAKSYGRRHARRAAHLAFLAGEAHAGRPAAQLRHDSDWLRKWAQAGGPELELAAHVRAAAALWRLSCPIQPTLGICGRPRPRNKGCLEHETRVWRPRPRRPGRVKQARQHLERALALAGKHGKAIKDEAARRALGQARLLLADQGLDSFLGIGFPPGLDFDRARADSTRRFARYIEAKSRGLEQRRKAYLEVITAREPASTVAAVARIGLLYQHFGEQMAGAPVPRAKVPPSTRGAERADFVAKFRQIYCETLLDKVRPLLKKASEAFALCMHRAAELGVQNARCTAELDRTDRMLKSLPTTR